MLATVANNKEVVWLLLLKLCNPLIEDNQKRRASQIAKIYHYQYLSQLLADYETSYKNLIRSRDEMNSLSGIEEKKETEEVENEDSSDGEEKGGNSESEEYMIAEENHHKCKARIDKILLKGATSFFLNQVNKYIISEF